MKKVVGVPLLYSILIEKLRHNGKNGNQNAELAKSSVTSIDMSKLVCNK